MLEYLFIALRSQENEKYSHFQRPTVVIGRKIKAETPSCCESSKNLGSQWDLEPFLSRSKYVAFC